MNISDTLPANMHLCVSIMYESDKCIDHYKNRQ